MNLSGAVEFVSAYSIYRLKRQTWPFQMITMLCALIANVYFVMLLIPEYSAYIFGGGSIILLTIASKNYIQDELQDLRQNMNYLLSLDIPWSSMPFLIGIGFSIYWFLLVAPFYVLLGLATGVDLYSILALIPFMISINTLIVSILGTFSALPQEPWQWYVVLPSELLIGYAAYLSSVYFQPEALTGIFGVMAKTNPFSYLVDFARWASGLGGGPGSITITALVPAAIVVVVMMAFSRIEGRARA